MDEDEFEEEPEASYGRTRLHYVLIGVVALLVLFILLTSVAAVLTTQWWFESERYGDVWSKLFLTKAGLFLVGGSLMALSVGANIVVAYRLRPFAMRPTLDQLGLDRYREAVHPVRRLLTVGASLVVGAFAGSTAVGQWRHYLLWVNAQNFGTKDPYFHKDYGFYVFELPWLHFMVNFVLATALLGLLAAAAVHYLYGGIRLADATDRLTPAARSHLSLLIAVLVLAKGADYWLQRYDALVRPGRLLTGVTWTDEHAVMPAAGILASICLLVGLIFLVATWRRLGIWPPTALGLLVASSVLIGMVWPGLVQEGAVAGSVTRHESTYVARNIAATRAGYGLDGLSQQAYTADTTTPDRQELAGVLEAAASEPLLDPQVLTRVFDAVPPAKAYYTVAGSLSLDHYLVDGIDRPVVVGVRGINQDGITDRSWTSLRTAYTHGSGVLAAFADQRTANGVPSTDYQWALGNGSDVLGLGGFSDGIYFGPEVPKYSVVGQSADKAPSEVDLVGKSSYRGSGGVPLDGFWRRMLFAVKYADPELLGSSKLNADSRILFDREPAQMVAKIAPWLTWDSQPYPVVVGGRVEWVIDGYTTSDTYPMSQRTAVSDLFGTSVSGARKFFDSEQQLSYIRDAVKATVDATDGTVRIYAWDENDPILKAWRSAFPGVVADRSEIPAELMPHLRYPSDLLKAQRYELADYHVTDPATFVNGQDAWQVAPDPADPTSLQDPQRLFVDGQWSLASSFVSAGKTNLAGYLYATPTGALTLLDTSADGLPGPAQAAADIAADPAVKELLARLAAGDERPVLGNLLTVPIGIRFLHLRPVYTIKSSASADSPPTLDAMLVEYAGKVGVGRTLDEALTAAIAPATPDSTVLAEVKAKLEKATRLFREADAARAAGHTRVADRKTARARALVDSATALSGS